MKPHVITLIALLSLGLGLAGSRYLEKKLPQVKLPVATATPQPHQRRYNNLEDNDGKVIAVFDTQEGTVELKDRPEKVVMHLARILDGTANAYRKALDEKDKECPSKKK